MLPSSQQSECGLSGRHREDLDYSIEAERRPGQKMPLFQSQNNGARHNQESASTPDQGEPFTEKERGKQNDEGHTQLVDGGNPRGFAKLESAKVAEPGQAGGQAGQD